MFYNIEKEQLDKCKTVEIVPNFGSVGYTLIDSDGNQLYSSGNLSTTVIVNLSDYENLDTMQIRVNVSDSMSSSAVVTLNF